MRHSLSMALAVCLVSLVAMPAAAQQWETYSSKEFDIQFKLPGRWTVETGSDNGVPTLSANSPDGTLALVVMSFKDSKIATEDLLDRAIDMLDFELEGEADEGEINGMHVWTAVGSGQIDGDPVGFAIQAMTYDDNNHVAYVFSNLDSFKRNAPTMDRILESFSPLKPMR